MRVIANEHIMRSYQGGMLGISFRDQDMVGICYPSFILCHVAFFFGESCKCAIMSGTDGQERFLRL